MCQNKDSMNYSAEPMVDFWLGANKVMAVSLAELAPGWSMATVQMPITAIAMNVSFKVVIDFQNHLLKNDLLNFKINNDGMLSVDCCPNTLKELFKEYCFERSLAQTISENGISNSPQPNFKLNKFKRLVSRIRAFLHRKKVRFHLLER